MEDSDNGGILATGIISQKKKHLLAGFITMHDALKKAGINPIIHRIDNEFSSAPIEENKARGLKTKSHHREITGPAQLNAKSRRLKTILNPSFTGVTLDSPRTNGTDL